LWVDCVVITLISQWPTQINESQINFDLFLNVETELRQVRRAEEVRGREGEARKRIEIERKYQELEEDMARLQMMRK